MEVNYLDLVGEGYMGSMQWQLGREIGTFPAIASRTQENQEDPCCECVFVALGMQHPMRLRHIVICALPRSTKFFHIVS